MSLKKTFSSDGKKCTVVFTVNPEAAAGATKVYLAGGDVSAEMSREIKEYCGT